MERHVLTIQGQQYWLGQGADLDAVKAAAIAAVQAGGGALDFVAVGGRQITVLLSPGVAVTFESEHVNVDNEDTGDVALSVEDYGLPDPV